MPALPSPASRSTALTLTGATCLLGILYAGRAVLLPLALAAILSLMLAPPLRMLGRLGLGRLPAILGVLTLAGAGLLGTGALLSVQLLEVSAELPAYRATIDHKTQDVQSIGQRALAQLSEILALPVQAAGTAAAPTLSPDSLAQLATTAWQPLGQAGLVLVLLLFLLLEQETLQDRLIRLAGDAGISRTVRALADAAHGVSRFFFCQLIVNAVFGLAVGAGLWLAGLPHALLWGVLSALLRFVPFIGALAAGGAIGVFAAAAAPGWGLVLACLLLFGVLELLVAHWIEPRLYAHSTGLSPLAVVVGALVWGTLWGPAGLLLATPLTVCLVVAGRHVSALAPLAIMLGRAPDVTGAQRLYQRALASDSRAIMADARAMLRRISFAGYCDQVLLPGLALAALELQLGRIDAEQQDHLRCTVAEVAEALAPSCAGAARRRRRTALLDANLGAHLRHLREARLGQWQGPLDVPPRSILLCVSLASERDELVSELLARALRVEGFDGRSTTLPLPPQDDEAEKAGLVSAVFIPAPVPEQLGAWQQACAVLRARLPQARLIVVRPPGDSLSDAVAAQAGLDLVLGSFGECLALAASLRVQA